jgi:hypothetical protein
MNKPERQVYIFKHQLTLLIKKYEPRAMNHLPLQAVVLTAPEGA